MQAKIAAFKAHVREVSSNPDFVHHKWFVKWHLEIVEKIAHDLLAHHPEADVDLVEVMVWLHDYGKALDFDNQYAVTLTAGRAKLTELGFDSEFLERAVSGIETLDKKLELDLRQANIEVQIVSSADGCSHIAGPFLHIFWNGNTDTTFVDKDVEQMLPLNLAKLKKDWDHKIVLPEARKAFQARHDFMLEQSGVLPDHFV